MRRFVIPAFLFLLLASSQAIAAREISDSDLATMWAGGLPGCGQYQKVKCINNSISCNIVPGCTSGQELDPCCDCDFIQGKECFWYMSNWWPPDFSCYDPVGSCPAGCPHGYCGVGYCNRGEMGGPYPDCSNDTLQRCYD